MFVTQVNTIGVVKSPNNNYYSKVTIEYPEDTAPYARRVEVESLTQMMASEPFTVEGAARMIEAVAFNLRKLHEGEGTLDGLCATYLGSPLLIEVLRRVQEGLEIMALQALREDHKKANCIQERRG